MSTTLSATCKIRWGWGIDGQSHRINVYARGLTLQGSAWYINSRTLDENDILWSNAAQGLADAVAHILGSGSTSGVARLFQLVDGIWVQRDSSSPTITASANPYAKASQLTMSLQTIQFHKVHVVVIEGEEVPQTKVFTPTGGGPAMDLFTAEWGSGHVSAYAPYVWQVGRDNQYLAATPFVSITVDLNKKIRRVRGWA